VDSADKVDWLGNPIVYTRAAGTGYVVRGMHYRFDKEGKLEDVAPVTRGLLTVLLGKAPQKNLAVALSAFSKNKITSKKGK